MISLHLKGYQIKSLCAFVGISRQAYYKRLTRSNNSNEIYNKMETCQEIRLQNATYKRHE